MEEETSPTLKEQIFNLLDEIFLPDNLSTRADVVVKLDSNLCLPIHFLFDIQDFTTDYANFLQIVKQHPKSVCDYELKTFNPLMKENRMTLLVSSPNKLDKITSKLLLNSADVKHSSHYIQEIAPNVCAIFLPTLLQVKKCLPLIKKFIFGNSYTKVLTDIFNLPESMVVYATDDQINLLKNGKEPNMNQSVNQVQSPPIYSNSEILEIFHQTKDYKFPFQETQDLFSHQLHWPHPNLNLETLSIKGRVPFNEKKINSLFF